MPNISGVRFSCANQYLPHYSVAMEKKHLAVGLAPVLLCFGSAQANFVYNDAIQGSGGFVSASGGGFDSDGYGLNPPVSTNSWTTGNVDIEATSPNGTNARVNSSFTSVMEADRLSFAGDIFDAHALVPVSGTAEFSYQQTFSVAFSVTSPMQVLLSASLMRQTIAGSPPFTQMFMEFGRKDGSPMISMAYPGDEGMFSASFPQTSVLLQPGDYVLQVFSSNFFKGSGSASYVEQMRFEARVPAPGTLMAAPLAAAALWRRRRN